MTYATVSEAHEHAMVRMETAMLAASGEPARAACLDALLAETEAVRLAFDRNASLVTRYVLLNSLASIVRTLADHVNAQR